MNQDGESARAGVGQATGAGFPQCHEHPATGYRTGRSSTEGCVGQDSPSKLANAHIHLVLLEQNKDEEEGQEKKRGPPL